MDAILYLTVLALGFFIGAFTIAATALAYEIKYELKLEEKRGRERAVMAYAEQFNVSYEQADAEVVSDPNWSRN